MNKDTYDSKEEGLEELNETFITPLIYTQFTLNFSQKKTNFLYIVTGQVNSFVGNNTPPPKS
ncbi:MAG: hypothetical protein IT239_02740 [Bacteroidia bacterium]|nr:hypothetical protein [Bacteroidia bacterium]